MITALLDGAAVSTFLRCLCVPFLVAFCSCLLQLIYSPIIFEVV